MECKKCGTSYEGASCPNCSNTSKTTKEKKPIYKKWWFWVIIAVAVIAIAGNSGGSEDPSLDDSKNNTSTVSGNADNTVTQSTAAETGSAAADENKYYVGDVINANGLNITYVSAETWESNNMFMQPDEGYVYIRLKLSAENTSSVDRYISSFEFECYADGKKESSTYIGDDTLEGGTLSTGRRTEGYIYFMVPADAQTIEVEYETNFWTDKKAILIVDMAN